MKRVSVVTPYQYYQTDRLFEDPYCIKGSHAGNPQWLQPFVELKRQCNGAGYEIHTSDVLRPADADIVLYLEPPRGVRQVDELRRAHPSVKHVLILIESPLHCPYMRSHRNLARFDICLTYDPSRCDGKSIRHYNLPNGDVWPEVADVDFAARRPAVLVSTNQKYGARKQFQTIMRGVREGWTVDFCAIARIFFFEELYSARVAVVKQFERDGGNLLDVFGPGWESSPLCRGLLGREKLKVLDGYRFNICFENVASDCGYVSEKIFDSFMAGVVPIYLGDARICASVPDTAFIDARQFGSWSELVAFVKSCDRNRWESLRSAGREFIAGSASNPFKSGDFARKVVSAFNSLPDR